MTDDTIHLDKDTLAIRYWLGESVYEMNAFIQNKCAYEFLKFSKELATIFKVDIKIDTLALEKGSVIQKFKIYLKGKVTPTAFGAFLLGLLTTSFKTCTTNIVDKVFEDKELTELIKEDIRLSIEERKINIENSIPLKTRQSNFYKATLEDNSIGKVSFYVPSLGETNKHITIDRTHFNNYIDNTIEVEPIIVEDACILIACPVIAQVKTKRKLKWVGIYNGETISFYMKSDEFKKMALNGEVAFKNGCAIKCKLIINQILNEDGYVAQTTYTVESVYEITDGNEIIETYEGKLNKQKQFLQSQPHLFSGQEGF